MPKSTYKLSTRFPRISLSPFQRGMTILQYKGTKYISKKGIYESFCHHILLYINLNVPNRYELHIFSLNIQQIRLTTILANDMVI